ncbi:hypothetical protein JL720_1842 [Aureococcus anophagefferens]|nr:hypothetical protein JL720_1842 [Aureococcus anophagefferens]
MLGRREVRLLPVRLPLARDPGVNAIFAEIMAATFESSPVPLTYVGGFDALALRERAHTGHFGLTRYHAEAVGLRRLAGLRPPVRRALNAYADLVLGGLRAIRAVARA